MIGYYAPGTSGIITPFLKEAHAKKLTLREYSDLPDKLLEDTPELFLICLTEKKNNFYLEPLKRGIENNPKTRFILLTRQQVEAEKNRQFIGNQENVEYLSLQNCGINRLYEILQSE